MNCHNHCTHNQAVDADGLIHCAALGGNCWVKPETVADCPDYQRHVERKAVHGREYWEPERTAGGRVRPQKYSKKDTGG